MKLFKGLLSGMAGAILASVMMAQPAQAALELTLSAPGGSADITDQGAGDICFFALNCITTIDAPLAGTGWIINITSGADKDIAAPALMDLNSFNIAFPSAGTLTILLSDDGFTPAAKLFGFRGSGTTTGGTISFSAYEDTTKFGLTNQIGTTQNVTTFGDFAFSTGSAIATGNPYSLTEVVTVSFGEGGGIVGFDAAVNPVPEPGSIALMLGGILVLTGAALRRKFSRS